MRKSLKNKKGFTLVEVIVVAVIVAVLAAVAIPLYMGYIKDSRQNVAENTAGSVSSAFAAAQQAGLTIPDGPWVTDKDADALSVITIEGKTGDNTLGVPKGYTVAQNEAKTSVRCYYTDDGEAAASKWFIYKN